MLGYVLVTAAKNEETFITNTLESVISQNFLPLKWVIVSDGSVDRTNDLVEQYAQRYGFIDLIKLRHQSKRNFGSKVLAIREGVRRLSVLEYEYIGNLDADISFQSNYFQKIFEYFEANPSLGITGGLTYEKRWEKWYKRGSDIAWSVSGAVQMFRRQCYLDIGGYTPLSMGGVDTVAEVMARLKGWEVRTIPYLQVYHHRPMGSEHGTLLGTMFRLGMQEYSYGSHIIFEILKSFYRIFERPPIIGSLVRFMGYISCVIRRKPYCINRDVVSFVRKEQMHKINNRIKLRKI